MRQSPVPTAELANPFYVPLLPPLPVRSPLLPPPCHFIRPFSLLPAPCSLLPLPSSLLPSPSTLSPFSRLPKWKRFSTTTTTTRAATATRTTTTRDHFSSHDNMATFLMSTTQNPPTRVGLLRSNPMFEWTSSQGIRSNAMFGRTAAQGIRSNQMFERTANYEGNSFARNV